MTSQVRVQHVQVVWVVAAVCGSGHLPQWAAEKDPLEWAWQWVLLWLCSDQVGSASLNGMIFHPIRGWDMSFRTSLSVKVVSSSIICTEAPTHFLPTGKVHQEISAVGPSLPNIEGPSHRLRSSGPLWAESPSYQTSMSRRGRNQSLSERCGVWQCRMVIVHLLMHLASCLGHLKGCLHPSVQTPGGCLGWKPP